MRPENRIMRAAMKWASLAAFAALAVATTPAQDDARPRARDIGLTPGVFEPGPNNAITDVAGVSVGHATLNQGDSIRTGVTVIVPHQGNVFQDKVPGAVFVGNAFGKLAGSTQVDELGTIETPIGLTNTLSVGAVMEGLVRWTLDHAGNDTVRSVNALVGETNDGGLNDIRGQHVRPQHVIEALKAATTGAVQEGSSRRRHRHAGLRMEGRHRHVIAQARGALRRLHRWRARAIQLRRRIDDGRRAGGQDPRSLFVQANRPTGERANRERRSRRRFVHDRGRDGRADRCARLEAARRARRVRPRAHRVVVQQRQR